MPKVSIILPTFNRADTIVRAIRSVQAQTYQDWELIVVDDGSADDTAEIARQFPFNLITIRHQGLSAARNIGLQNATGEIIAYIDDDAWPDTHWLNYLALTFKNSTCAGAGGSRRRGQRDAKLRDRCAVLRLGRGTALA